MGTSQGLRKQPAIVLALVTSVTPLSITNHYEMVHGNTLFYVE